jgi:hypothetical protein
MSCPILAHENVCVQADVKITPEVKVGEIKTYKAGEPFIGACCGTPACYCTFCVSQQLCVQVPLAFHACAEVTPAGIVCGVPAVGGCCKREDHED